MKTIKKNNEDDYENLELKKLGCRIKSYRVRLDIKQSELAAMSRVSMSTIVRLENGEDTKITNLMKILKALQLLDNFNRVIPEPQKSYKKLYARAAQPRKRASRLPVVKHQGKPAIPQPWVWAEDIYEDSAHEQSAHG